MWSRTPTLNAHSTYKSRFLLDITVQIITQPIFIAVNVD